MLLVRGARPLAGSAARLASRSLSTTNTFVLTLNAGSSSIKFGVFDVAGGTPVERCGGIVEEVGSDYSRLKLIVDGEVKRDVADLHIKGHGEALANIRDALAPHLPGAIAGVGHRVVHGGASILGATLVDDSIIAEVEACSALAPLHNPANALGIRFARDTWGAVPHVVVPDTAFHTASMQPDTFRYALPKQLYDELGVRRYGFHGTSYAYVTKQLAKALGKPVTGVNAIICHLGSGASMCAVEHGKSIDTTMGLTPLEGLVMGTRAGDVDAGVLAYLAKSGYSPSDLDTLLNKESGLKGLSGGLASDMRAITKLAEQGDADAALARSVFVERCRKYVGAYAVKLKGRVDAIVFCGGIGEGDADCRRRICADLEGLLGCEVDATKNQFAVDGVTVVDVSVAHASTKIFVVPTNEELEIATQTAAVADLVPVVAAPAAEPAAAKEPAADAAPPIGQVLFVDGGGATAPAELGLLFAAMTAHPRVGFFRPVHHGLVDRKLSLFREVFDLDDVPVEAMYGVTEAEANKLLAANDEETLIEKILTKYLAYAENRDFILVSRPAISGSTGMALSTDIAAAMQAPVCWVHGLYADGTGEFLPKHANDELGDHELAELAQVHDTFRERAVRLAGVVVANLPPDQTHDKVRAQLKALDIETAALLPHDDSFEKVTVAEIGDTVGADLIYGDVNVAKNQRVDSLTIATLDVANLLTDLDNADSNHQLVVVDARRADVILAVALASRLKTIAGLLLTGPAVGEETHAVLADLDKRKQLSLPILKARGGSTYQIAHAVSTTTPRMLPSSTSKLDAARSLFDRFLEPRFRNALGAPPDRYEVITPKLFQHHLFTKARRDPKRIVLPEGNDRRVVVAAGELLERGLVELIILGDRAQILATAEEAGVVLPEDTCTIVDPLDCDLKLFDSLAEGFYDLRKHKGVDLNKAKELVRDDPNTFGAMMMKLELADGMVSGACHATAATMRPALQILKTAPGFDIVSSVFFMLLNDGVKVFGDCAINVAPSADELAQIAVASARTARQFGVEPRVAMLSYASGDSNQGALIDTIREATAKAKSLCAEFPIEGPIQFDAAVDKDVAAIKYKGLESEVAGHATVCVFPDLNSGNNGYKAVQQASKTIAVGPIMQGLAKPVNDLSRGCTVEDIVNTVVITALQSQRVIS